MLVLTRKVNEEIIIGEGTVVIKVVEVRGDKVRIGVTCDKDIPIHRAEVQEAIDLKRAAKLAAERVRNRKNPND